MIKTKGMDPHERGKEMEKFNEIAVVHEESVIMLN
jgi:hypothetical protein